MIENHNKIQKSLEEQISELNSKVSEERSYTSRVINILFTDYK